MGNQPESNPGSDQDVGPTTPDSQTSGDQPISRLDEGARAEVSQIVSDAVEKTFKRVQSLTDKTGSATNKAVKAVHSEVQQLRNTLEAKNLLTPEINAVLDEAANEGRMERLESKLDSLLEKGIGSLSQEARIVYDEAFKDAGYDMATLSPEDQAFAIKGVEQGRFKSQADLTNALFERIADQRKTKPVPDGSGIVSPGGGGAPPDPGVKTVTDEYKDKYVKAANEGASQDELLSIKAEYRTKGAAVDSVRFSYKTGKRPG